MPLALLTLPSGKIQRFSHRPDRATLTQDQRYALQNIEALKWHTSQTSLSTVLGHLGDIETNAEKMFFLLSHGTLPSILCCASWSLTGSSHWQEACEYITARLPSGSPSIPLPSSPPEDAPWALVVELDGLTVVNSAPRKKEILESIPAWIWVRLDSQLCMAADAGDSDRLRSLLKAGAAVNSPLLGSSSALCEAAENRSEELALLMVRVLLEEGADPNFAPLSLTPLMCAARAGHSAVVSVLLAAGADATLTVAGWAAEGSFEGTTALMYAAERGNVDVVRSLIEAGAPVNAMRRGLDSALTDAIEKGHGGVVRTLVQAGADVNAKCRNGSILWLALHCREADIAQLLRSAGAVQQPDDPPVPKPRGEKAWWQFWK